MAVQTCLAFAVDRVADRSSSLTRWDSSSNNIGGTFGRQALPIVWDFAETGPLAEASGDWSGAIEWICKVIERESLAELHAGHVEQIPAQNHTLPNDIAAMFFTDPPYYDAVPYADLSDFYYVWLKRSLHGVHQELFRADLSPKDEEVVQLAERNKAYKYKTKQNFERLMQESLARGREITSPSGLGVVVFAHKETTAWETMLNALVAAGWTVTASWPIDTELANRMRALGSAVLASSVHLVCRPREAPDGSVPGDDIGDWRDVLQELPHRIHEWMPRLAEEGVVGADAIFACLGPALEIFSRYSRVERTNGEVVPLGDEKDPQGNVTKEGYLSHVWAAVSTEALSMIFRDADAAGLEPDARLTAMWLWTLGGGKAATNGNGSLSEGEEEEDTDDDEAVGAKAKPVGYTLEFDAARKIAQGLGVHLEKSESIVAVKGETARLLPVSERTQYLFGKGATAGATRTAKAKAKAKQKTLFDELGDAEASETCWTELKGPPPGSTVLDRLHQAMILFAAGRGELMKRFLLDDGVGRDSRFWKLAQSLSALYPPGSDEKRWVDGVLARKKGLGL